MGRTRLPAHLRELIAAAEPVDIRPRAKRMDLVLPFPQSMNNLYPTFVTPDGKIIRRKSKAAYRFEAVAKQTVGLWLSSHNVRPPAPPYRLILEAYPPQDGHRHDASNLIKLPEDAVMAAIGGDDNDVLEIQIRKVVSDPYPRLVLVLESIREEEI